MKKNNYAFIDGQNLYLNIISQGWKLDYLKFRIYLRDKYNVSRAFMFLGFVEKNKDLYDFLTKIGFIILFKEITLDSQEKIKGNCDAELVLQVMIEFQNYDRAIIVSGDGDFYCLVKYLVNKKKLEKVLVPDENHYSRLFNKVDTTDHNYVLAISQYKDRLIYIPKMKRPQ